MTTLSLRISRDFRTDYPLYRHTKTEIRKNVNARRAVHVQGD